MKPKLLLRIAVILLLLHDAGHSSQIFLWKHPDNPGAQSVVQTMTSQRFPFMGAVRSFGEFYEGFLWAASLAMLFIAAVLWIVSNDASNSLSKKILIGTLIILTGWWIVEFNYFFLFAAANTFLAWLLVLISIIQLRSHLQKA
jgi:hypothetical protein